MSSSIALKYAEEVKKRLDPNVSREYVNLSSKVFPRLVADPFIDHEALAEEEPALHDQDHIKFLIIGGGHNGLLYAYRLIEAGFKSDEIRIVDTAGGFGGTWYWNRYPGIMCDVESYVYIPLLEETGYMPKLKYSHGSEIRGQSERIAAKWNLRGLFSTKVDGLKWDEETGEWDVEMTHNKGLEHGDEKLTVRAQFVFSAGGVFYTPHIPKLPGFDQFMSRKQVFHTSRWDYDVTGGSQDDPSLVKLKDKVVGIIGTGATAVQVIPHLARWAKHLYVFQRTASYCSPRKQKETTEETWLQVANGRGWQYKRQQNFNSFVSDEPAPVDLVNDGWTDHRAFCGLVGGTNLITPDTVEDHVARMFKMDEERANRARARIDEEVKDSDTAQALKPWYGGWCKRPTFHDDFLGTFNLPNVTLVDTDGKGVHHFTDSGVFVNGADIPLDIMVMATGFATGTKNTGLGSPAERLGARVIGRGDASLDEKWAGSEHATFYSLSYHGFPNFFSYGGPGGPSSPNLTSAFDIVAKLAAHIIAKGCRDTPSSSKLVLEATREAEKEYTAESKGRALWFAPLDFCTPGYFTGNAPGKAASDEEQRRKAGYAAWGGGVLDFQREVDKYIKKGVLEGIDVRT
ncbi:hypothetical protein CORC01_13641 [Colletotrichum orchidophilum]|uniref:Phenylacetone monooxygenase n=1 Tax=Colletotrichum orchidophilum TaxID=1209926 RepID=A0A1G4APQ3_9PEZI|nr:uncharacterized protein CORC01_13641 [Colletotrichum orchidophilum]OHE91053.1 hypothetical protein CORC01_13641 [Colletotrichum orchidophilum]